MAQVVDNGADLAEIYATNDETVVAGDVLSLDATPTSTETASPTQVPSN